MRTDVINHLDRHPDLWKFIRQNPEWYHKLSRHPGMLSEIKDQADDYFGRSMKKKIEKFGEYLGMLNMFMEMTAMMEDKKEDEDDTQRDE